jgi:hypothetical protein
MRDGIRAGRVPIFVIGEVHAVMPHRSAVPGRLSMQVVGGHFGRPILWACKRESDSTCTGGKRLATHGSILSGPAATNSKQSNTRTGGWRKLRTMELYINQGLSDNQTPANRNGLGK